MIVYPYFTVTEYYINECNGDDRGTECGGTPGDPNDTSDTFDLSSVQDSEGNQYKCVVSGGTDASLVVDPYPNYGVYCRFDIDDDIDYETKASYSFEISLYEWDGSSIYGSPNVESITLFVNNRQ